MTIRYAEPFQTALDDSGLIIANAKLETFQAGTTTPLPVYSDPALTVPLPNPVIADDFGRFPDIYLLQDTYKFVLKDSNDVVIRESDQYDNESLVRTDGTNIFTGVNTFTNTVNMEGAAFNEAQATTIISAATTDIGGANGNYVEVTGTNTITSFGSAPPGAERTVRFAESLTITYDSINLILPGGNDIITDADDMAIFRSLGGGSWICSSYERSNGGVIDLVTKTEGELTIDAGEVTAISSRHTVDTEADAPTDDLDTINGGVDGKYLLINTVDNTRHVVLKHSTGNLFLSGAVDRTLALTTDIALFQFNSVEGKWIEITGAGGSTTIITLPTTEFLTTSGNFIVPAGVTELEVEIWGPGGATVAFNETFGGLGAGGYAYKKITGLTPLDVIPYVVGTPGVTSSFGAFVSATSGQPASIATRPLGTAGGTGIGGDLNLVGGHGTSLPSPQLGYSGRGGSAPRGGQGGRERIKAREGSVGGGHPGEFPGGGASGQLGFYAGQNSASGLIIVRY